MTLAASTPTVLPSRRKASKPSKSSISLITSLAAQDQKNRTLDFWSHERQRQELRPSDYLVTHNSKGYGAPTGSQTLAHQGDLDRLTV